ncbi:MAG: hypothetical protein AAF411_18630 [Myxococcota bacterium]
MAKRQPKSKAKKKREKKYRSREARESVEEGSSDYSGSGGGVMRSMVGGFRRAVGAETKKSKGPGDYIWTILLVVAIAIVLFYRFGQG